MANPVGGTAPVAPRPRRRRWPWSALALLLLLGAFATCVVHLLRLRFDVGDVYPPYSTLRGDPLGTKVLFDSLRALPALDTQRSLRPLTLLGVPVLSRPDADHGESQFACFYLGANSEDWPNLSASTDDPSASLTVEAAHRLDQIVARGGRVIVTFQPTVHVPTVVALSHRQEAKAEPSASPQGTPKPSPAHPTPTATPQPEANLITRWGVDFHRRKAAAVHPGNSRETLPAGGAQAVALPAPGLSGAPVPWRSVLDFDLESPAARAAGWHALYLRQDRPVVIARHFDGGGELILVSDTYFLSNEGLHESASSELLATLIGPARVVLFDESHFGIREHPGLMTLARRYRLQGALAVFGLLAALFVWRNAVSLVPPRTGDQASSFDAPVVGRDAAAGFLNLLRRGVAPRELAALCVAQWRQHLSPDAGGAAMEARHRATPANIERLQQVLAGSGVGSGAERRSPAALYRELCLRLRRPE